MTAGLALLLHVPYEGRGTDVQVRHLGIEGAPGERVALSFDVRSVDAVTIEVEPAGPAGGWLEVFVVKVWEQAGVGVYRGTPVSVPELLLKDDGVELADGYGNFCGHRRHVHRLAHRRHYYRPPSLRLDGLVRTALRPNEPKQIWITAAIPPDVEPGTNRAAVTIRGPDQETTSLGVTVTVLPFRLLDPPQERFLWYRGTIDCARPQHYVPENVFRAQLADIHAHGFRSVSLNEVRAPLLRRATTIAREVGFSEAVVIDGLPPAGTSRRHFAGLRPLVYVSDEIDQRGPAWFPAHQERLAAADRAGLPTMSSIVDSAFLRRLSELGPTPDIVSLYLPKNLHFFHTYSRFPEICRSTVFYYWMAHMEKPNVHRVLAGFYLWKSGAAGIAPYCYQHLPVYPNSPYDDFDDWEPAYILGDLHQYKDHMATYPAATGAVPTLQWEGLGDGITDLRYVATVEHLLAKARDREGEAAAEACAETQKALTEIAESFSLRDIDIVSDTSTEPYPNLTAEALAGFRARLAVLASALTSLTDRS